MRFTTASHAATVGNNVPGATTESNATASTREHRGERERGRRTGDRDAELVVAVVRFGAELRHAAEQPERDAVDRLALAARDDRVRELVGEDRGEEQHDREHRGREVRAVRVGRERGKLAAGERAHEQHADHQQAPVDADLDAGDPTEANGRAHAASSGGREAHNNGLDLILPHASLGVAVEHPLGRRRRLLRSAREILVCRTSVRIELQPWDSTSRDSGSGQFVRSPSVSHPLVRFRLDGFPANDDKAEEAERGSQVDREKALDMALAQIDKQFGKGSIMKLGERGNVGVEAIPTGALALDLALGIGGLPRGRIVEIFGPESSGKSTLAMHVVAEAQRNGGMCAYIDAEHAMDPVYGRAIGVNVDELLISQPDTGEQALEIADMLIRSGALDVLVIDSVAALVPRAEIEGEMGDTHMGLQARLMSQALRKLTGNLNKSRTIAIFINQLREKIGVMFGSPETTPGGRALKFYSSVRLDIRRIETIKDGAGGRRQPGAGEGRQEQDLTAVQAGRVRHHVRQGHQP